jgi:hypothetical protein
MPQSCARALKIRSGTSEPVESAPVTVFEASIGASLVEGSYNAVRAGQVVPVRLELGCGVPPVAAPRISVLSGDVDPETTSTDPVVAVPFTGANGADTSGVMRLAGGAFVYELRVPEGAAGSLYTVRIRPLEASSAAVSVVLRIRK